MKHVGYLSVTSDRQGVSSITKNTGKKKIMEGSVQKLCQPPH